MAPKAYILVLTLPDCNYGWGDGPPPGLQVDGQIYTKVMCEWHALKNNLMKFPYIISAEISIMGQYLPINVNMQPIITLKFDQSGIETNRIAMIRWVLE